MKTAFVCAISFALVAAASDVPTLSWGTYTNAKILRAEPDGLTVMTSKGVSKLPLSDLPTEIQAAYGYSPTNALEYRKKGDAAQANSAVLRANSLKVQKVIESLKKEGCVHVNGRVLSHSEDGLHVDCSAVREIYMYTHTNAKGHIILVGYEEASKPVTPDGSIIDTWGYRAGLLTYESDGLTGTRNHTREAYATSPELAAKLLLSK